MNRILIVEDEVPIAQLIEMSLARAGYQCEAVNDGCAAADKIEQNDYDLVLLDIMLPRLDGYELLEYLRPMGTPVIFITAKGTLGDRVRGLNLGADDYIVKPFEVAELVARVESVLRRTGRGGALLRAWDVTVDTVARSATKAGVPVALTPREFDLLEQLLRNRGAALYRDVLFERVWGGEMDDGTRTLDLHIQRLRKKLGWQEHIKTVYKVGYLLEMEGEP
ncbi:response regulator [Ruthenibacterium lactatiformans]|uniref:Stage 0 sporulation protein A homolog n=1 Tax=Ruthenibacterium lactatiformans TaxID=1550024 RepID=A0A0D8J2M3_9FIRM|nr:response regulator transcription factor [Ruthenibacterium lactatiformans]KJF40771.1 response regulator [Ruthenibacterium lactatiformans]